MPLDQRGLWFTDSLAKLKVFTGLLQMLSLGTNSANPEVDMAALAQSAELKAVFINLDNILQNDPFCIFIDSWAIAMA